MAPVAGPCYRVPMDPLVRASLLVRVAKFAALKVLTSPPVLGAVASRFQRAGRDYEDAVADRVRGVAKLGSREKLRFQPCEAQLALLERRIRRCSSQDLDGRRSAGRALQALLDGVVRMPGQANRIHDYWVFPILVDEPERVIAVLRRAGFDASSLPRSQAVSAPDEAKRERPVAALLGWSRPRGARARKRCSRARLRLRLAEFRLRRSLARPFAASPSTLPPCPLVTTPSSSAPVSPAPRSRHGLPRPGNGWR